MISTAARAAETPRVEITAELDATSRGGLNATWTGVLDPWGSLDESGIRLRIEGIAGIYQYTHHGRRRTRQIDGSFQEGDFMVGYEKVGSNYTLAGFLGVNAEQDRLSRFDRTNPVRGTAAGLQAAIDFNMNPTENSLISAYGTYSTAFHTFYTRFKTGLASNNPPAKPGAFVM